MGTQEVKKAQELGTGQAFKSCYSTHHLKKTLVLGQVVMEELRSILSHLQALRNFWGLLGGSVG